MIQSDFKSRGSRGCYNGACTVYVPEGWKKLYHTKKGYRMKVFQRNNGALGLLNNSVRNSKTVLCNGMNAILAEGVRSGSKDNKTTFGD